MDDLHQVINDIDEELNHIVDCADLSDIEFRIVVAVHGMLALNRLIVNRLPLSTPNTQYVKPII